MEYLRVAESTPNGVDSLLTDASLLRTGSGSWPPAFLLCRFVGSLDFRNPDVLRTRVFADVFCAFGCQAGPFYSMRVLHSRVAPCSGW